MNKVHENIRQFYISISILWGWWWELSLLGRGLRSRGVLV